MTLHDVWFRSPLLRIVLPLLVGIYCSGFPFALVFLSSLLILYACYFFMRFGINRHWNTTRTAYHVGIFYSLLWLALGIFLERSTDRTTDAWHALRFAEQEYVYAIRLADEPIASGSRWKAPGEVISMFRDSTYEPCRGRIALTIECDSSRLQELHVDDVVVARLVLRSPEAPRNPMEFDYATYLQRQDIWLQAYVRRDDWVMDSLMRRSTIRGTLIHWREQLLHELAKTKMEQREVGVLSALVLGKSSAIDKEVLQTYSSAGVVHVLAVSGLHVALIYMLLKPIFERVWGRNKARKLKTLVPTLLLWLYAAMTGFSPSVLRAAWMFSFVIVADNYGLRNTGYNTMSASAVLLIAFDPQIAFSMGFMLSYLAVLGIAAIHPALHRLFYFKNRVGKWLWELSSISISAQLATMPLTLYLFHQFPTWFVLTNALVIPLSTIILYLALFFFAVLACVPLASFVGGLLGMLTRIMNDLMQWSASWPYALIDQVYWEPWEAVFCACLIVAVCMSVLGKKRWALMCIPALISIWLVGNTIQVIAKRQQSEVCFHSYYSGESITAYNQGALSIVCDLPSNDKRLLNYRLSLESNSCDTVGWQSGAATSNVSIRYPWLQVNDCIVLIADSSLRLCSSLDSSVVVLFTDKGKPHFWKPEELRNAHGHTVILGNNLSRKRRAWLHKELRDSCRVFDLNEGAVVYSGDRWMPYRTN
jgi:competence protein ComEC